MAVIFDPQIEGMVVALSLGRGIPASMRIKDVKGKQWDISTLTITNFSLDQQSNTQFLPTLRRALYIYSFGDKIGNLVLSGVAFHKSYRTTPFATIFGCARGRLPFIGLRDLDKFYRKNNISKSIKPLFVSFGSLTIRGFLTGYRAQSLDPELNLVRFSMSIAIPPNTGGDESNAEATSFAST